MELKFTPRAIMNIEDRMGLPITEVITKLNMKTIAVFVAEGQKIELEQALDVIEQEFANGNDMVNMFLDIMKQLQKDGFLPKALNIQQAKDKMEQTISQAM